MIRVSGQDLLRPVNLFGQHGADQHMRPGLVAQRQQQVGAIPDLTRQPVGATDDEGDCRPAIVAPTAQLIRELFVKL